MTQQLLTLDNVLMISEIKNPVVSRQRINPPKKDKKWKTHELVFDVSVKLSNGKIITINGSFGNDTHGFYWDKSSVPQILWSILSPEVAEIGALVHDWLYVNAEMVTKEWFNGDSKAARKFADKEMLLWCTAIRSTNKISFRNIDNQARYIGVRLFGKNAWEN